MKNKAKDRLRGHSISCQEYEITSDASKVIGTGRMALPGGHKGEPHEEKCEANVKNEWTETSDFQPDDLYGYGYLGAVWEMFCRSGHGVTRLGNGKERRA